MTQPSSNAQVRANRRRPSGSVLPIRGKAITIVTKKVLPEPASAVWESLVFYEQIQQKPPLLLRLLLPMPLRSEGTKEAVGDVATCVYAQGHLLKQVTRIDLFRRYEFQVIEQKLAFGGGLQLLGGSYTLRAISTEQTELSVTTRYISLKQPRRLWMPIEAAVCHAFHRFLLLSIQKKAAAAPGAPIAAVAVTAPVPESAPHPLD